MRTPHSIAKYAGDSFQYTPEYEASAGGVTARFTKAWKSPRVKTLGARPEVLLGDLDDEPDTVPPLF